MPLLKSIANSLGSLSSKHMILRHLKRRLEQQALRTKGVDRFGHRVSELFAHFVQCHGLDIILGSLPAQTAFNIIRIDDATAHLSPWPAMSAVLASLKKVSAALSTVCSP